MLEPTRRNSGVGYLSRIAVEQVAERSSVHMVMALVHDVKEHVRRVSVAGEITDVIDDEDGPDVCTSVTRASACNANRRRERRTLSNALRSRTMASSRSARSALIERPSSAARTRASEEDQHPD